tara:strand:+ start:1466 stop:2647 length:1182 start_codon:yes stop_codon:yes gene_type:complete
MVSLKDHKSNGAQFTGQYVFFTGNLSSISRQEAFELVKRFGGVVCKEMSTKTTVLVVGADGFSDVTDCSSDFIHEDDRNEQTNVLKQAEALNNHSPNKVNILSEDEFCALCGLRTINSLEQRYHNVKSIRELYPVINESRLRYLDTCGLIRPVAHANNETYYKFSDIVVVKRIHDLLSQGKSFRKIVRRMLVAQDGQLVLDFSAARNESYRAKVVALRYGKANKIFLEKYQDSLAEFENPQTAVAARFFLEGSELDEGNHAEKEKAQSAYRKALLLDPNLVPAIVNLANIHYASDELVEAQALYARALQIDPDCFEAYFNLGNIHHDLGRHEEALECYSEALRLNPTYADAHFYMAVTLEKMGRSVDSKSHWQRYQQLAPDGEWVDLAKEFSE